MIGLANTWFRLAMLRHQRPCSTRHANIINGLARNSFYPTAAARRHSTLMLVYNITTLPASIKQENEISCRDVHFVGHRCTQGLSSPQRGLPEHFTIVSPTTRSRACPHHLGTRPGTSQTLLVAVPKGLSTHLHARAQKNRHTHTNTPIHTHACTPTYVRTHASTKHYAHTRTHAHTPTPTYTFTNTSTHARQHMHTRKHIVSNLRKNRSCWMYQIQPVQPLTCVAFSCLRASRAWVAFASCRLGSGQETRKMCLMAVPVGGRCRNHVWRRAWRRSGYPDPAVGGRGGEGGGARVRRR